jgi:integrase
MTFNEYVAIWKSDCRINVSDGWKLTQDAMLKNHVLPSLGKMRLDKIKSSDISALLSIGKNKGHKANTTKQTYLLLSKLFSDARDFHEFIDKSPVKKKYHCPKAEKMEAEYLSPEDAEKLMESSKYHWSIQAITIQLFIGLRVGEVIALKWKDIDFKERTILIRSKWNRKTKIIDEFPKNKRQVKQPFAGRIEEFLKDLKETVDPAPNDFVCPGPDSKTMMSYHSYQKAIVYLCKDAKVPRVSSHAFRHTCSTLWVRQGATSLDVQLLLNHESLLSTKTYLHDDNFRLRELAERVMKKASA